MTTDRASRQGYISLPEIMIVCVVVAAGLLLFWACWTYEHVTMPAGYAAWVKQTGNPQSLTYEEWRALVKTMDRGRDGSVLFVPMMIPR